MKPSRLHSEPPFRRCGAAARYAGLRAAGLLSVAATLSACTGLEADAPQALRVEPVLRVSSGAHAASLGGYLALARQYAGEGRWGPAAEAYRQAAALDSQNADTLNMLGHAEAMQQRYPAALAAFERALALAPGRADLLNNLAYTLMLEGRPAQAAAILSSLVQRAPGYAAAQLNLRQAQVQLAQAGTTPAVATMAAAMGAATNAAMDKAPPESSRSDAAAAEPAAVAQPATAAALQTAGVSTPAESIVVLQPPAASKTLVLAAGPAAQPDAPVPLSIAPAAEELSASLPTLLRVMMRPNVPALRLMSVADYRQDVPPIDADAAADIAVEALAPFQVPAAAEPLRGTTAPAPAPDALAPDTRIVVINGNGVTGAAARLGQRLLHLGLNRPRLANLPPYTTAMTTVQYRPGFERQARALAHVLPVSSMVEPATTVARGDLRVIIGHDMLPADHGGHLANSGRPEPGPGTAGRPS